MPVRLGRVTQLLDEFDAERGVVIHTRRRHTLTGTTRDRNARHRGRDRLNADPTSAEIAARGVDDTVIASHVADAARLALPDRVDGRAFLQGRRTWLRHTGA